MKIHIKRLKEEEKGKAQKILLILILINLLMFLSLFFTPILTFNKIVKQIIISLIAILNIVGTIYIIILSQQKAEKYCTELNVKYNPILIKFFYDNEIKGENKLMQAELLNLINNGFVIAEKENDDYMFTLQETGNFERIGSLEQINKEVLQTYNNTVPCYENIFVTKVLFPFENKITLKNFEKNLKENYYCNRLELCKYAIEKALVYQLEKDNILSEKKDYKFTILTILNIVCVFLYLVSCGSFNILLFLATIFNIITSCILLKNEKVLAYSFNEDIKCNMECIEDYAKNLSQREEKEKYDSVLDILFNDKTIRDLLD